MHVLFIEDDPASLTVYEELCQQAGIAYTGIATTSQLIKQLPDMPNVDVVVIDLEMPNLNGYEVRKTLLKIDHFRHVPIVVCSAYIGEISRVHDEGFQGFIAKPIKGHLFIGYLQKIAAGQQVWDDGFNSNG